MNALLTDVGFYPGVAIDVQDRDVYLIGIDKAIDGHPDQFTELILRSYIERQAAYRAGVLRGGPSEF